MIITLSESKFLLAIPPELLSPGRSGNAQTSDNAPTPRLQTSPSRQMQEGVRHKPWRLLMPVSHTVPDSDKRGNDHHKS